jgi:TolB-like protein
VTSFFSELKRRNVYRVGSLYLVVSWGLAQAAGVMEGAIGLPDWFDGFIIATLALCFPVALLLAWAFEKTPQGIRRTQPLAKNQPSEKHGLFDWALLAALLGIVGLIAWQQLQPPSAEVLPSEPQAAIATDAPVENATRQQATESVEDDALSVAVLPFRDLSPDQNQSHFSDGVAEEILNVLSRVRGLKLASRPSSFRFRERSETGIIEIARALDVRYVLDGSLRKAGDAIRVSVQLIDGLDDRQLWSKVFDRTLTVEDVFQIQDEISQVVVSTIGQSLDLSPPEAIRFTAAAATDDLGAYDAYLLGREIFAQRGQPFRHRMREMVESFERAVQLDPEFERGWEALAAAYAIAPAWNLQDRDYLALARETALKALAMNDNLGLAHAALGLAARLDDGRPDKISAVDHLTRAIELEPFETSHWDWRGQHMAELGFFEAAKADLQRASEIDPDNIVAKSWLFNTRLFQGRIDEVVEDWPEAPNNGFARPILMRAYAELGRDEEVLVLADSEEDEDWMPVVRLFAEALTGMLPDYDAAYARSNEMFVDLTGSEVPARRVAWHYAFKQYQNMPALPDLAGSMPWWYRVHDDFLNSTRRFEYFHSQGLEDYWRERGFPPMCEAAPSGDYRCM